MITCEIRKLIPKPVRKNKYRKMLRRLLIPKTIGPHKITKITDFLSSCLNSLSLFSFGMTLTRSWWVVVLCVGVGVQTCVCVCGVWCVARLGTRKDTLCADSKRLRVYVQDVSVCTGKTAAR